MKFAKHLTLPLVAAGLLTLPATAFGAGFQNTGQSATSTAMGYTGVANPDEPNASFYNPASMGFSDGLKLYLGDTIIVPTTSYTPGDGGETVSTKAQTFPPPNAHLSYDNINDTGLSFGTGLTFSYGLGIAWPDDWIGRTNIRSQDLQTANVNPNVAYKVPGVDLSVAAGAQFIFASVDFKQSLALGNGEFVEAHLGGTGFGIGGVFAAMYQPVEDLTLGLQYRSRVGLDFSDASVHFEGDEDTAFNRTFRDNPASTEMTLPDLVALGVGYQLDKLFLTFDVNYTLWETYDNLTVEIDTDGDEEAIESFEIVNDWENAFAFRLGGEYEVVDDVPIRLGVAYDMTPIPDETVNASLPGNDRVMGTLGMGYTWSGLRMDLAYSLVKALDRDIQNDRAPNGVYQTTANSFAFNVGYGY